jgi:hypothetical protein
LYIEFLRGLILIGANSCGAQFAPSHFACSASAGAVDVDKANVVSKATKRNCKGVVCVSFQFIYVLIDWR